MLSDLHLRVQLDIRQQALLQRGERLLVALSGGQDSLCLLQILLDLMPRWQWQIYVVHCDHRWTPQESEAAQAVHAYVTGLGLPIAIATAETIQRDEAGARAWRYAQLATWAETWHCSAVVTGHTASDRAETVLFNLLRGATSQGLGSLTAQRPLTTTTSSPRLVRPLLGVYRHETAAFCWAQQLPSTDDPFNHDLHYQRVRLRHELLPYLQQHFNPQVETALNRSASVLEGEAAYLEQQCEPLWQQHYCPQPPRLPQSLLKQQHLALQRRLLWRLLNGVAIANFERVEQVRRLVSQPSGSRTASLPGGYWGEVSQGYVVLRRRLDHESTTVNPAARYDG